MFTHKLIEVLVTDAPLWCPTKGTLQPQAYQSVVTVRQMQYWSTRHSFEVAGAGGGGGVGAGGGGGREEEDRPALSLYKPADVRVKVYS